MTTLVRGVPTGFSEDPEDGNIPYLLMLHVGGFSGWVTDMTVAESLSSISPGFLPSSISAGLLSAPNEKSQGSSLIQLKTYDFPLDQPL